MLSITSRAVKRAVDAVVIFHGDWYGINYVSLGLRRRNRFSKTSREVVKEMAMIVESLSVKEAACSHVKSERICYMSNNNDAGANRRKVKDTGEHGGQGVSSRFTCRGT